eukprot:TRINITY_DN74479_c0_g1_i1.p1 TRINITY_DN74479_c0_g1~~TRINITY_DN74479_c0_g1_i1.p1  ORF type:complete len:319 (+),score=59.09 TRINITY_DN74479_c0_g1_i1:61-1017(+)
MGEFSDDDIAKAIAASLKDAPPEEEIIPEPAALAFEEAVAICMQCSTQAPGAHAEEDMLCDQGCGRSAAAGFKTCCKSCAYLHKKKGFYGHDIACDVRCNGGTHPPWYWKCAKSWPNQFHQEVGGEYVKNMGTKLLQVDLPDCEVVKCERVEDAVLWSRYVVKRAEIRKRVVKIEDVKPETSKHIDFSANTTLDHDVNEVWLFHGTDADAAHAIAKSSFVLPKGPGGLFGPGAYFADSSLKSHEYAGDGELPDSKVMLLCRVTLGSIQHVGEPDRRARSMVLKDPNVDSILGNTGHREFIVYDTAQIYPEYILQYKKL